MNAYRTPTVGALAAVALLLVVGQGIGQAQEGGGSFTATNQPGTATTFSFQITPAETNLSMRIANTAAAYSHLYLKRGSPPAESDFEFRASIDGQDNAIHLETPELGTGEYFLMVRTPPGSAEHAFEVMVASNSPNLRTASTPVSKRSAMNATGSLDVGGWHYFKVDLPAGTPGWRVVLSHTGTGDPDLFIRRGSLPTQFDADKASQGQSIDTLIFSDAETAAGTYFVGVRLPDSAPGNATYTLSAELGYLTELTWDPGLTHEGTMVHTNRSPTGGDYYFKIKPNAPAVGVWRTALNVRSGEAHLYMARGAFPSPSSFQYKSDRPGSDGFVLASTQFGPAEDWYILVTVSPAADWILLSGDVYVQELGTIAADASSGSGPVAVGPEGVRYFKTTTPANLPAWRLWLNGAGQDLLVKKAGAPHMETASYDLKQTGQMLVVPDYLTAGQAYFVGVPANPGSVIDLDSRVQPVSDLSFGAEAALAVTGFGCTTYRVQVPLEQIAWQIKAVPALGDPNIAVRRNLVPNEFNNDAFSEAGGAVADSLTLVPPGLSDGTFYITVYGNGPHTFTLSNGNPVITDISFVDRRVNDDPDRVGWRFYRVANIEEQLGTLGWNLFLENQAPGAAIALRRNAVPGWWTYRSNNNAGVSGTGYVDASGGDFLQRPGHQADIWYVGIYSGGAPLGTVVLNTGLLTAEPLTFDGGSVTRASVPAGKWEYFRVEVPAGALGWDVRAVNVVGGRARLSVRRGVLPDSLGSGGFPTTCGWPEFATNWPGGAQWAAELDWTGREYSADGTSELGQVWAAGMGHPLEPGTYYVGVLAEGNGGSPVSYMLVSRGVGEGMSLPVVDLPFAGGTVTNASLMAREAAYYRVVVPENVASWQVKLKLTEGEALLGIMKGAIPGVGIQAGLYVDSLHTCSVQPPQPNDVGAAGRKTKKAGDEHFLLLPPTGQASLSAGAYYLAVVSEGQNAAEANRIGTGPVSYVVESVGELPVIDLGTVAEADLVRPQTIQGGQVQAYRFRVPDEVRILEVGLEDRVGNPVMALTSGPGLPKVAYVPYHWWWGDHRTRFDEYGSEGGEEGSRLETSNVLTLVNLAPGVCTVLVKADSEPFGSGIYPDANYTLRLRRLGITQLGFDGGGQPSSSASASLADNRRVFFSVSVPPTVDSMPTLGWKLDLAQLQGDAVLRVRKDRLPDDEPWAGTSTFAQRSAVIVAPYLSPGTWYVEVKGIGSTAFVITSSAVRLERSWPMPIAGEPTTHPGLAPPSFGDSGVKPDGVRLPDDQGVGLAQGDFHYYAVTVPEQNANVLRVQLDAISGDPNLYVRTGAPPTLTHDAAGHTGSLHDCSLTGLGTDYGNFVPLNRWERQLTPGTWYLAVHAAGNSNVRYRLRVSTGTPLVQDLAFEGGQLENQLLAAGDWRYYRVNTASDPPVNWIITLSHQLGSGTLLLRDTVPPGMKAHGGEILDWGADTGNSAVDLFPQYASPGTYTLSVPPVRPGATYYLGVRANSDSVFSIRSASAGPVTGVETLAFYGGQKSTVIPAGGQVLFRIPAPADATRWIHTAIHSASVTQILWQDSPRPLTSANLWNSHAENGGFNQYLLSYWLNGWDMWGPDRDYYLVAVNNSGSDQPFSITMDGRNAQSDDNDNDGLPDAWERRWWGEPWAQTDAGDPDGDGVSNLDEFREDTNPTDPRSLRPRLVVTGSGGTVLRDPVAPSYALGTAVTLTATADANHEFVGWSGGVRSADNPLVVTLVGNLTVRAVFIQSGFLAREVYVSIPGSTLGDLTNSWSFSAGPNAVTSVRQFESPVGYGEYYGVRLSGLLRPPVTGNYRFFLDSDDEGALFLSTDETPFNRRLIAREPGWNGYRQWVEGENQASRGSPPANVSDEIFLEAGRPYYVEALMQQGTGRDYLGVAWELPGGAAVTNGTPPISAEYLATEDPANAPHPPSAPVLAPIPDLAADEGDLLTVTNGATDSDWPLSRLSFELLSGPPGVNLDAASGVLTWTPTETQGPATYAVVVKVTDDELPPLSATNEFTVVVREVNAAPVLATVPEQTVNELTALNMALLATDADIPANGLTYGLVSGPAGLAVSAGGAVTWTPTEDQGPGTFTVLVKVTDDGVPALSVTNEFTVVVREVNVAPVLAAVPEQTVDELSAMNVALLATDADVPANTLTYGLVSGPDALAVSVGGAVTWTPTEDQGPGTFTVLVKVTDDGVPALSATNEFTVVVREVNVAPILAAVPEQTVDELTAMDVTLLATDADVPANTLTYGLVSGPDGLGVSGGGAVTWTPTEDQGPGTFTVVVKVTDDGVPTLSSTNEFTVVVREANVAPVLAATPEQTVDELTAMDVTLLATDADVPANTLTYGLVSGPDGLGVSGGGAVTWTPTEDQGPGTFTVVVKVTDDGVPTLRATNEFTVVVREVNVAPEMEAVGSQEVRVGQRLEVLIRAADPDIPVQMLAFSIVAGPLGAVIDAGSGQFTWTPLPAQENTTNRVTIRVEDGGLPVLSDSVWFQIVVPDEVVVPEVLSLEVLGGTTVVLTWSSEPGATYRVQRKRRLTDPAWSDVGAVLTATGTTTSTVDVTVSAAEGYYRIVRLP